MKVKSEIAMKIYGISSGNVLFTGEMVHGSFVTCDAFEFNQDFEGLDVLFIVSAMENKACEEETLMLAQKARNKGILTLALFVEDKQTTAMNNLQQQVNALLILSGEGWGDMPISERYALVVQRMLCIRQGSVFLDYKDLCDVVGLNQKLFVSYCIAQAEIELETVGGRLLSAYPRKKVLGIEHALFFGRFNERNLMGLTIAVSRLESLLHEDCHLFFTSAEIMQENRYFDAILFTR